MMEFDHSPDHVVDQCNFPDSPIDIREAPAIELECVTSHFNPIPDSPPYPSASPFLNHSFSPENCHGSPLLSGANCKPRGITCPSKITFPMKLWELLEEGQTSLVRWAYNGFAFILDPNGFDYEIQAYFPGEFGDNKLRNFCRQLRVYDFNEVTIRDPNFPMFEEILNAGTALRIFYHHSFRRGQAEHLLQIVRVRDIVPRGRSRPKHPKPKPVLPAPTGPYLLGQGTPMLKQRSYEPSPRNLKPFGINTQTVADHLGCDHPLVTSLLQQFEQNTVDTSAYVEISNEQKVFSIGTEASLSSSQPLLYGPDSQSEAAIAADTLMSAAIDEVLPSPNYKICSITPSVSQLANIDSLSSESSQDFSDGELRSPAKGKPLPKRIVSVPEMGGYYAPPAPMQPCNPAHSQYSGPMQAITCFTQSVSGLSSQTGTALVLVPCLKTGNQLIPLSLGGSLSEAGISLLQASSEFQNILNQLKPEMTSKGVQHEGQNVEICSDNQVSDTCTEANS